MIIILRLFLWSLQYSYPFNTDITTHILDRLEHLHHTIHNNNTKHCEYHDINNNSLRVDNYPNIYNDNDNCLTFEKYIQERLPSKEKARHKGCSRLYNSYHRKRPHKDRNKRDSETRLKLDNHVKITPKTKTTS